MARLVLLIFLALAGAGGPQRAAAQAPAVTGCVTDIDHERLPALLTARGFVPPQQFKALVIALGAAPAKTCQAFDWHGSARDRADWWPASSVKLFAAVAALEHARSLGFSPSVKLTYHYADGNVDETLEGLVHKALIPSDNKAFDRLVELVGFDRLHERFFTPRNGFSDTVFLRSYSGRIRDPETHNGVNRNSPVITLAQGDRSHELPEQTGKLARECPDQGNCTTLLELSETLRRVMLHEQLPKAQRFALDAEDLKLLRRALATPRPRGMNVVDGLRAGLGAAELRAYHKPGFALQWMSDAVFLELGDTHQRYIVALAGYPGRESLDAAARAIGELLASGALTSAAPVAPQPAAPTGALRSPSRPCRDAPEGMACVPGAEFTMGVDRDAHRCDQPGNTDAQPPALPAHRVRVDSFFMDLTEVTNAAYETCVARGACPHDGPRYHDFGAPEQAITGVSWYSARAYCRAAGKRLPTEAEWELAARGPDGESEPWGDQPADCARAMIADEHGRSCGRKQDGLHPEAGRVSEVASRPAGRYGLYDMIGNAEEWVADWWSSSYAECGADCAGDNPRGPCAAAERCPGHTKRVVRGGSWYWPSEHATGYHRRRHWPDNRFVHHFGFRCAADMNSP